MTKSNSKLKASPQIDCHDVIPCSIFSVFSEAYFPVNKATISLSTFPTTNGGMINSGRNLAIPPATNKGVVGNGMSE